MPPSAAPLLLRTPTGLATLGVRVITPARPARDERRDREIPGQSTRALALDPLRSGTAPRLEAAWDALARVSALGPGVLLDALTVLLATCPAGPAPRGLPAFAPPAPPAPPRATAAHPRAYRGTRHQPPAAPAPRALDLRPYLLDPRTTQQVLAALRPHVAAAARLAPGAAVVPLALEAVAAGIDPYLAVHHGVTAADPALALPSNFVSELLPTLRPAPRALLARAVAHARALAPATATATVRASLVALSVAAADPARFLAWCELLALVPPARRALLLALVLETSAGARVDPAVLDPAWFVRFTAQAPDDDARFAWRAASLLAGLSAGATPGYLATGFALADAHQPDSPDPLGSTPAPPAGRACPADAITALTSRLSVEMRGDSGAAFWALHLWRRSGECPGMDEVLAQSYWLALAPRAAFALLRFATSAPWYDAPDVAGVWQAIRAALPDIVRTASELAPDFQHKFVADATAVCWHVLDRGVAPGACAAQLSALAPLLVRTARAPFSTAPGAAHALRVLARAGGSAALLAAPDRCFLALERACRRENDARLLTAGLDALVARAPVIARGAFVTEPGRLAETVQTLGALSHAAAVRAVDAAVRDAPAPLFDPDAARALPIEPLARMVSDARVPGGTNPVPRALRAHLAGERALSLNQLERCRRLLVASLDLVRLDRIEHAALAALAQPLARTLSPDAISQLVHEPAARHALALLAGADENRRGLRRLLRAHWRGETDWRLRHPRTRAWLARHPRLARDAWLGEGPPLAHTATLAESDTTATLAIERDPLEALRLGTYVGSCLGLGGAFTYSAAAVALDVNKQVVYARDPRGVVLARQLVAVSEEDTLVAFDVYPGAVSDELRACFRAFDQALARAIGLPLRASGEEYTIAAVLAQDCWDDAAP